MTPFEDLPAVKRMRAAEAVETCRNCDGAEWVCENHRDRPWDGRSDAPEACGCGAGAPCPVCSPVMACATYSEPWRELADRAIGFVESAVRETSWGQPTFGPDYGEELRAEYDALTAQIRSPA